MRLPPLGAVLDSELVNAVVAMSPEWDAGVVDARAVERIGADYGLSGGYVYRVEAESEHGSLSFVVKHEGADAVERALRFHRSLGSRAAGSVPALLGGVVDDASGCGVLVLEDVSPAVQGDVLAGCSDAEAVAAVRSLARVHADTRCGSGPVPEGVPRWTARVTPPPLWAERVAAATAQFSSLIPDELVTRLGSIPERAERAVATLGAGAFSWIHGDAHLDNVLFRPDGAAVLLDWSGAMFGPPAIDLARLLTEGLNAGARPQLSTELVIAYNDERALFGVHADIVDLWAGVSDALVLLVQSAVGWAARNEDREPIGRMRALQERLLQSVLAWGSSEQMTREGRVFAA